MASATRPRTRAPGPRGPRRVAYRRPLRRGKDTTLPTAKLDARRDSIRDGRVAVWVTASEAATVTATGTLGIASHASTHRLRTATAKVVGEQT